MPLQQPFGDVGIPDRQRGRDELAGHTRIGQHRCGQPRATPARQPQPGHQQHLDHDAAVDEMRGQRDREILRQGPRRRVRKAKRRIG